MLPFSSLTMYIDRQANGLKLRSYEIDQAFITLAALNVRKCNLQ